MRILLTGKTGQVGRALLAPLAELGHVIPVGRDLLDLALPETIPAALDLLQPDLIVNPAAYTAVDRAEDEPALAYRVNAEAPGTIAGWAARRQVPLLHFSTDYIFDGSGTTPWREQDPTQPLSIYGASKLAGEMAVRGAAGPHLVVRTSWVYSNHGQNFLLTMARLAAERIELKIVADQWGAPTSARVIADTVCKLLTRGGIESGRFLVEHPDTLNVACSGTTSWHGFATAIIEGLRTRDFDVRTERIVPIASDQFPTKAVRPANSRLDLGRLMKVFGLDTLSWHEALEIELDDLAELRRARIVSRNAGIASHSLTHRN